MLAYIAREMAKSHENTHALAGQSEPKREKRTNDARAVPEKVKDAVLREVKEVEEQCGETTPKFVLDIFSQQGHEVKADFVRKFLHANGKSLRKPTACTASELDDD
jgi:hypothetical protein